MLFFAGGRRLLATHPPVLERLRALDPGYDEDRLRQEVIRLQLAWDQERSAPPPPAPRRTGPGAAGAPVLRGGVVRAVAAAVLDTIGDPTPRHVAAARELRRQLPRALERMCGVPDEARAFVIALLLSDEAEVRARQAAVLEAAERARLGLEAAAGKVRALAAALPAQQRLSAVLRLFPALRQLPAEEQDDLGRIIADLALADGRLDVFEFALGRLVACELHESRNPRPPHGRRRLDELLPQIALLVAVLGRHGADDGVQSRRAYSAGMARLSDRWPDFHAPSAWAAPLSAALEALRDLQPAAKELLMEALVTTVTHDGQVRVAEAELLRTVAVLLQCPLPPLLPDGDIP